MPCHILIEIDRSVPGETIEDRTTVLFKINSIKWHFIRFHFCLNPDLEIVSLVLKNIVYIHSKFI